MSFVLTNAVPSNTRGGVLTYTTGNGSYGKEIMVYASGVACRMQAKMLSAVGVAIRISAKRSTSCDAQGWQVLTPQETSFFAAVNLPMLDFHSRTGPEADFNSGMQSL